MDVMTLVEKLAFYPLPLRVRLFRSLARRLKLMSFEKRVRLGAVDYAYYGYCMYNAARLARKLGHDKISVIEFGVAAGAGLMIIERHADELRKAHGVDFEIYGFDTGGGLPAPKDYRDLPYVWQAGQFATDVDRLKERLSVAKLVLGDVCETVPTFFAEYRPAPVGCVFIDLDFYSSTKAALELFAAAPETRLPRVYCFFDDITGSEIELANEFSGERLAINEFNEQHRHLKLSPIYSLGLMEIALGWHQQIYALHDFEHPSYNTYVGEYPWVLPGA